LTGLFALIGLAWASATEEIAIERGRLALDEGRTLDARRLALDALDADASPGPWQAHRLYLQAAAAAGAVAVARAELAVDDPLATLVCRWFEAEMDLRAPGEVVTSGNVDPALAGLALGALALADGLPEMAERFLRDAALPEAAALRIRALSTLGEDRAALRLARSSLARWPEDPSLLAGLATDGSPPSTSIFRQCGLMNDTIKWDDIVATVVVTEGLGVMKPSITDISRGLGRQFI
jgi:hypothetical protein